MRYFAVFLLVAFLAGCAASPAGPVYLIPRRLPGPEEELVGVVNGLWRYSLPENQERLRRDHLFERSEIQALADRHMVRVGISRGVLTGRFAEYVLLPEGWRYSAIDVVDDGKTINVGDVVVLRAAKPRRTDYLIGIKRKCNAPPASGERPEWSIGCIPVTKFGKKTGYGGEQYVFSIF